ncbi:MAG: magnesium transporter [Pseudomonadota bacterium]
MVTKEEILERDVFSDQEDFESHLACAIEDEQFSKAKNIIAKAHIADLAGFFDRSSTGQKESIVNLLTDKQLCSLIIELDVSVIPVIIEMIGYSKTAKILTNLDTDQAIHVLESLEDELHNLILSHLKPVKKKELQEALAYPENSAGRLMQKKFIAIPEHWTTNQAIEYMKTQKDLPEVFYEIFVVDYKNRPVGKVAISTLLAKEENILISDIMHSEVKSVKTDLDEEEVTYLFKRYGYVTIPVVNKHGRLVGAITLKDAVEVMDKQAEENIMHMGGVKEDDLYLNVIEVIKSRFPWLLVSLIAATLCSLVVNLFHDTIQQIVVLSAIMPIIAGISGNAGTQTMTVTVLSLSSKELTSLNISRVIIKQIISCGCNGLMIALVGGILLSLLYQDHHISFVFGLAVTINFALAGFLGATIPIILDKFNFDPAIASPVFVTTLTDILSFAIFLGLAAKMLL